MAKKSNNQKPHCSFCGRETDNLLQGMDGAYICPDCLQQGNLILQEMGWTQPVKEAKKEEDKALDMDSLPKP